MLGNSFYSSRECKFEGSKTVSMDPPPGITIESIPKMKNVLLTFNTNEEAIEWDREMILWEKKAHQMENQRSITKSLRVEDLNEALGLQRQRGNNVDPPKYVLRRPDTTKTGSHSRCQVM